jgi:hypothetical protein
MKHLVISVLVLIILPVSVSAAGLHCSTRLPKDTVTSSLPCLAKVSQDDAQKAALARVNAPSIVVAEGELEVEQGCLVYSFDIKIPGKPGIEEIIIDAGTGMILSQKHESANQEAAEKAKDKASSTLPY